MRYRNQCERPWCEWGPLLPVPALRQLKHSLKNKTEHYFSFNQILCYQICNFFYCKTMRGQGVTLIVDCFIWFRNVKWIELWLGSYISCYYSFKIFPRFWLVKTTRILRHNQLLVTRQIWTNDVKSTARCTLLNRWPRKSGDKVVLYLVSGKTKSEMATLFYI